MGNKIRISVVVGTRPNLIKISPLVKILANDRDFELQFIDTGQHYDYELDEIFIKELGMPKPIFLDVGSGSHAEQTGTALIKIGKELAKFRPDVVLVMGDTNSTLAGALAASKMGMRLGHIEAGLRSFDRKMPEEINRVVVDHLADMLFAPTETAMKNLKKEGIPEDRIFFTHDISVDACLGNYKIAKKSKILDELAIFDDFVLVTLHRPTNVDRKKTILSILDALSKVSKSKTVIFPIHPRTLRRLHEFGIYEKYSKFIKFIKPQGYFDFLKLLGSSACVITDSGGVQKEALILKVPCVTIRDTTEWPETLELGANVLVTPDKIVSAVLRSSRKIMESVKNPFGDGKTSGRILEIVEKHGKA